MASMTEIGDKLAIHELMARYNFAIDFGDVEAWVACFTEDGVIETPFGTHRGSEALRKYVSSRSEERRDRPLRHMATNIFTDVQGDQASARCFVLITRALKDADSIELLSTGVYSDNLRKIGGAWRFSYRKIEQDTKEWAKQVFPPSYLNQGK